MQGNIEAKEIYYQVQGKQNLITCDMCIHGILGDKIDLEWHMKDGKIILKKSSNQQFSYEGVQMGIQRFKGVPFTHSDKCPLEDQQFEKNPERKMKPCSCILLYDKQKKKFLITKRATKKSLGNAWLLPGGHLETNETMSQCALRQCEEEIGLNREKCQVDYKMKLMVYQNPYVEDKKIKKGGMIIYLAGQCDEFEPTVEKQEISEWKWKNLEDKKDQTVFQGKQGYGEGFLKYLQLFRSIFI